MAINKNALLRYQTLDRCFRNTGRIYKKEDLLEAVNDALYDEDINSSGIQLRQLDDDIAFMRSESGYDASIITYPSGEGRKMAYRYEDPKFSITNSPLNETEALQLKNVLTMFNRFEGSPGFEWISQMGVILKDRFKINTDSEKVISFESNIDYSGYIHITQLFNSIINKRVLKINYAPFISEPFDIIFHPYYLKQYNNRWFVFGLNQELEIQTYNLALDRIVSFEEIPEKYLPNSIDWEFYFSEIYGVSKPFEKEEEVVELLFNWNQAPYIITKPLHGSQKDYEHENGLLVKLKLIPNFELEQLILSFGERVEVLSPLSLRNRISDRLIMCNSLYNLT
jgi:predicted DNA-binding transcriptional regulator YafY